MRFWLCGCRNNIHSDSQACGHISRFITVSFAKKYESFGCKSSNSFHKVNLLVCLKSGLKVSIFYDETNFAQGHALNIFTSVVRIVFTID